MKESIKWGMILFLLCIMLLQTSIFLWDIPIFESHKSPIKVGLVYATTGYRRPKEIAVREATLMAIDEINQQGGILGRKIIPIVEDSQSDEDIALQKAEKLINRDGVKVVFGCKTFAKHSKLTQLFEHYRCLLINPFQYEEMSSSPYLIFTGTTSNQQILPTIDYCFEHFNKQFILIGSNYFYSYLINRMIYDQVRAKGGKVLKEIYLPLVHSDTDWQKVVQSIASSQPATILSTLMGQDNPIFFRKLAEKGLSPKNIPIFSFTLTEINLEDVNQMEDIVGCYATWNYFQSIDSSPNENFVKKFLKFSKLSFLDNAAETGYFSVYLWAQAIEEEGTTEANSLNYILSDMRIQAPEGIVTLDIDGQQTWRYSRIGRLRADKQFDIIWQSSRPLRPLPYQIYYSPLTALKRRQEIYQKFKPNVEEVIHEISY